jgi:TolA-binding protein
LAFRAKSRRISLKRGRVELMVPPLRKGASLSVSTPDAVVTVHGTQFSVEYSGEATCVRVREGLVSVQRGARVERLRRGQQSGCAPVAGQQPSNSATLPAAQAKPERAGSERGASRPKNPAYGSSGSGTLTKENMLFRQALAAEQVGDLATAEAHLARLLDRYPGSPLASEARRALARVRAGRQHSSGRATGL